MKNLPVIALSNLSDSTLAAIVTDMRQSARVCEHLSCGVPEEYSPALDRQADALRRDAAAIEAYAVEEMNKGEAWRARKQEILARWRAAK